MVKRRYTLVLILSFLLVVVKGYSYDFQFGGIYYSFVGNNVEVSRGDYKYRDEIVIPEKVTYNGSSYNVTSIGYCAFSLNYGLTSITIPNSVTGIGDYAFEGCSGLTSITISSSLKSIGDGVFRGCSGLTSITIPNSVTSIGSSAFSGCSGLTSITIPNSMTSIGSSAFSGCSGLTSIIIPNSVTIIGDGAFSYCSELTSIRVDNNNNIYDSYDNCNAIIETATNKLIAGCKNTTIPNSVTSIGNDAFDGCSGLSSIIIPNSVTIIGDGAFSYCSSLTSISIPNSVTSIGIYAFQGCSGLTSINVDSNNRKYDSRDNCNAIIETSSNTLIAGCKNTVIPNFVTSIGKHAFDGCSGLTSITIPTSVTSIGIGAFSWCSGLTSITIPNSVTSISNGAFWGCSGLTSITIPNSVTSIDYLAFFGCSNLTSVISEIKNPFEIKEDVFSSDTYSKASLTVPNGSKAKYQSTNYWNKFSKIKEASGGDTSTKRTIHVATAGTLPNLIPESEKYIIEELTLTGELNGTDFRLLRDMAGCNYLGVETAGKLKVLDLTGANIVAGGEKYIDTDNLPNWGPLYCSVQENNIFPHRVFHGCKLNTIVIPNSVTSIGNYAFYDCSDLTSITIPNSVTSIGYSAFSGCSGLTSITIPNSVTSIGEWAFLNCSGLTSVTIPNSVTSIDFGAFSGCSGLASITVEEGNTKYDSRDNCNAIIDSNTNELINGCKNTIIPNTVTSIGRRAFSGCSGLASVTIPNSVTSIGDMSFGGCSGLTSVTIPNSVTSIGGSAFYGCSGLTSITIPNSVTSIGISAFFGCSGLTSVFSEIKNPFEIEEYVFSSNIYSKATLTVPSGTKTKYQQTNYWNKFQTITEKEGQSYTLDITASGYGYASYNGTSIRNTTRSFTVAEGESATINFSPDEGYRVASLYVNNNNVTSNIYNNSYTISNLSRNTTVKVTFESIPVTTYSLDITASGYGYAYYDGTSIRNSTRAFIVNEGESATISFSPDEGYRVASLYVNNTNLTSSIYNNSYTINNLSRNTTVKVTFEAAPVTTYSLDITASGYGYAYYDGTSIRNSTRTFTVTEGASATIDFSPDEGHRVASLYVNNTNVTSSIYNNSYTINNLSRNTTVKVTFEKESSVNFNYKGITYVGQPSTLTAEVQSVYNDNLMEVEIPSSVESNGKTYTVTSVADGAFSNRTFNYVSLPSSVTSISDNTFKNTSLGALIWNAKASLPSSVFSNMAIWTKTTFLLYVNDKSYAPLNFGNVVVGNSTYTAEKITLEDGTNTMFYCPKEFTAQSITYTHKYSLETGGKGKGWESIALPFNVQKITHASKGELTPFASYQSGSNQRPFWLMELSSSGFTRASAIKANTPYIIAMPNSTEYEEYYIIRGNVTFSANNVKVAETSSLVTRTSTSRRTSYNMTFTPAFAPQTNVYALNVYSDTNPGSEFIASQKVYPFQAYMTTNSNTRSIGIEFNNGTTDIDEIPLSGVREGRVRVYSLGGQLLINSDESNWESLWQRLPSGVYIVNGKKTIK